MPAALRWAGWAIGHAGGGGVGAVAARGRAVAMAAAGALCELLARLVMGDKVLLTRSCLFCMQNRE